MSHGEKTIREMLSAIASERAAPAGGSVAAVVGAMAAALCEMVCLQAPPETQLSGKNSGGRSLGEELRADREELLDLADADAAVVDEVFADGSEEPGPPEFKRAVGVPLSIAEACVDVIKHGTILTTETDRPSTTDAKTGVILANAALRAAILTVRANCALSDDQEFIDETTGRVDRLETEAGEILEAILPVPDHDR